MNSPRTGPYVEVDVYTCLSIYSCENLQLPTFRRIPLPQPAAQELEFIEFFAGDANVYRSIRVEGTTSAAVDIQYLEDVGLKANPFDITTSSGLATEPELGVTCYSCSTIYDCFSQGPVVTKDGHLPLVAGKGRQLPSLVRDCLFQLRGMQPGYLEKVTHFTAR